jgi:hypothetical protein
MHPRYCVWRAHWVRKHSVRPGAQPQAGKAVGRSGMMLTFFQGLRKAQLAMRMVACYQPHNLTLLFATADIIWVVLRRRWYPSCRTG